MAGAKMKPILFNTEMLKVLLANRKTVTRRVVKPKFCDSVFEMVRGQLCETESFKPPVDNGDGTTTHFVRICVPCKPPCRPGDILYVPERWKCSATSQLWADHEYQVVFWDGETASFFFEDEAREEKWQKYIYKPEDHWQSPYFMPKEAARIFLRVTDVRVERLQDITEEEAEKEGCDDYTSTALGFFYIWDSTLKPKDLLLYGWDANPWVWVIEFERISREEALYPIESTEHPSGLEKGVKV